MATTELLKETIKVAQVGKFGVRVGETWYNTNDPLKPSDFVAGQSYEVGIQVSKTGKKYIKSYVPVAIVSGNLEAVSINAGDDKILGKITSQTTKDTLLPEYYIKNGYGKPMSQYEIDLDSRISKAGLIQAALQSPGLATFDPTTDEYWNIVVSLAEKGIKFVENNK